MMVEHTSINPNKAAHIGHLRNAVLGDTFCRVLRYAGRRVEVQNYIDNTGVQVADVVLGFLHLEPRIAGRGARAGGPSRNSTTSAGICTRASRSGSRKTKRGSNCARKR